MNKKWIWVLVLGLCVVILAGALFIIQAKSYHLFMTMQGERVMAVEVGQDFTDPGATAESYDFLRGYRNVSVTCQGTVDTLQVGVYELTYTAELKGILSNSQRREHREVHVVESLDPVITLHADPDTYTLPGSQYQEEGYTATDWYDGDITHLVQRTEYEDKIVYSVTSSSGRSATAERPVVYNDPIAPELVLTDGDAITISAGTVFQDPGFTATDNLDGDLTGQVQVSGEIDPYTTGEYTLTYTVTDSWGNTATAVRNVTVEFTLTNPTVSTGKVIYLTFDDGPSNYTGELLDILAKYNVKATFFVVNTGAIAITGRMVAEGHSVGIHSATHNFSYIYSSEESYYADLYYMQSIIAEHTGQTTYLLRFPGGSSNSISKQYNTGIMTRLSQSVRERGFQYFDWNVDSDDAGCATTAEEVYNNVVAGVTGRKTAIVLQHDTKDFSVAAVERIIMWGLMNGYTFLPLTAGSPSCSHVIVN